MVISEFKCIYYTIIQLIYKWKVQVRQKYDIILHNFSKNFTDYTGIFDKQKNFMDKKSKN